PTFSGMLAVSPSEGDVWLAGITQSDNFPTKGPLQPHRRGGFDAFLTHFDAAGKLTFSTYLGAGQQTIVRGMALSARGGIFLSGTVFGPAISPGTMASQVSPEQASASTGFTAAVATPRLVFEDENGHEIPPGEPFVRVGVITEPKDNPKNNARWVKLQVEIQPTGVG